MDQICRSSCETASKNELRPTANVMQAEDRQSVNTSESIMARRLQTITASEDSPVIGKLTLMLGSFLGGYLLDDLPIFVR